MNGSISVIPDDNRWLKKFLPIWIAQIFSLLGSGLVQFAFVWWLTQKTGSAAILATATFVALLPEVLLAPFSGALVDRWNRRLVMILSDGFVALVTLVLVVLFATDKIEVWHIYVALGFRSLGGIFQWPAMQASTSMMVPEKHLARVAGINQAIRGSLNIICAPLGALLMSLLAFYQVVAVDVLTAFIAVTLLFFIYIPQPKRSDASELITPKRLAVDIAEGFKYMKIHKGLLYITLLAAFLNFLLAPSGTLLPLLVTQHFGKGVWELSLFESIFGIGAVTGGLVLGAWGGLKSKALTSLIGVVGIGLGVLIVGIAPASVYLIGLIGFAVCGLMNPIANGPLIAILQTSVPHEMQGRVLGLTNSICTAMMPLSMIVVAPVAELLGLQVWFWVGGALTMIIGFMAMFSQEIMNLDKLKISQAIEVAE